MYVVGDGQPHLAADLLGRPCRAVAHKGRVVNLAAQPDAVCDEVDVQIIGVLVCAGYSLVFAQVHFVRKRPHDVQQVARPEFRFVLRGDADLEAQVLILTPLVVAVDHLEFEAHLARIGAARQIGRYNSAEFASRNTYSMALPPWAMAFPLAIILRLFKRNGYTMLSIRQGTP